ncbi:periplasmic sensor diguanylate cyclase/phosphodiesterase [Sphingomonas sp. YR710]|uniref:putative bifunctional diguanylate cyclase/phosphodiesterase n=1 Tax=Sphingomonas sp. YR710 TaxID=1882773 RepID=UPI00088A1F49|nr:EAL domain-containing protein [Sphingomonas sp. YR710]SDD50280.1 periplasmic sensor diguanylate cyclase/phosphodiesterase [Sphingomonas sp. YR710]
MRWPAFQRPASSFGVRFLAPLIGVTLAAIMIASLGLYWSTSSSDAVSVQRQIRTTRLAISTAIDDLALQQETVAVWDETAQMLTKPRPNQTWLRDNVSLWLNHLFNHDEVFILDGLDRPIHAGANGSTVPLDRYAHLALTLEPVIAAVRGRTNEPNGRHDRLPNRRLASDNSVHTTSRSNHASRLLLIAGRPAAVSAMLIRPSTPGFVTFHGPEPILVSIRYLDTSFLTSLSERNLVAAPRFSLAPAVHSGEQEVSLREENGSALGYIIWRPELPGTAILTMLAPATMVAVALIVMMMTLLARWLIGTTRSLEQTMLELRASEAHARHLAMHDVLTGLPNRALFDIRLGEALATMGEDAEFALLALDLDRFKNVNDTLGHLAGDRLIRQFAERLQTIAPMDSTMARLGGDEFALLVPVTSRDTLERICRHILDAVQAPFDVGSSRAFVGVSIGVVRAPADGTDRAELLRKADIALYNAKNDGRNCYRFFSPEMGRAVQNRGATEDELRMALGRPGELAVHYQVQVHASTGAVAGFEALVRWHHPRRGLIGPDHFIAIAEEAGLIDELGEWVLSEACAVSLSYPDLYIGVNLSPAQFRSPDFADRVIDIILASGAAPGAIELEVTEGLLLEDCSISHSALKKLRDFGMRIVLDDFGTGYSSLNYLRSFAVDKIKIDKNFVAGVASNRESGAIAQAVITLGHAMGLKVTAEGVETEAQRLFLANAGCDIMQGHLFGPSCAEEDLARPSDPMLAVV